MDTVTACQSYTEVKWTWGMGRWFKSRVACVWGVFEGIEGSIEGQRRRMMTQIMGLSVIQKHDEWEDLGSQERGYLVMILN